MDQTTLLPVPPPPAPVPAPVFPTLPTTAAKNITRVILLLSSLLVGVGGWYANVVETDPETAAVIGEKVNVPGLVTAGTGILGIVLGLFQQKQHSDQAAVAVAQAAAAPPVGPGGMSVGHTLNTALTQASQLGDFVTAGKVLGLLKEIGTPKATTSISEPTYS